MDLITPEINPGPAHCSSCPFFARLELQCRQAPPIAIALQQGPASMWPPVRPEHWCGSHPANRRMGLV